MRSRRRSSSSATGSSRFMGSATPTSRWSTRPRTSSSALRPDGLPPQAITVSFRSAPEILAFVNDVFAAIVGRRCARRRARGETRSGMATRIGFRSMAAGRPADETGARGQLHRRRHRAGRGRTGRGRDRPPPFRRDRAGSHDRRAPRGPRGRRRHPVPVARQPPRVRSGAGPAGRADLRVQRARVLRSG